MSLSGTVSPLVNATAFSSRFDPGCGYGDFWFEKFGTFPRGFSGRRDLRSWAVERTVGIRFYDCAAHGIAAHRTICRAASQRFLATTYAVAACQTLAVCRATSPVLPRWLARAVTAILAIMRTRHGRQAGGVALAVAIRIVAAAQAIAIGVGVGVTFFIGDFGAALLEDPRLAVSCRWGVCRQCSPKKDRVAAGSVISCHCVRYGRRPRPPKA